MIVFVRISDTHNAREGGRRRTGRESPHARERYRAPYIAADTGFTAENRKAWVTIPTAFGVQTTGEGCVVFFCSVKSDSFVSSTRCQLMTLTRKPRRTETTTVARGHQPQFKPKAETVRITPACITCQD